MNDVLLYSQTKSKTKAVYKAIKDRVRLQKETFEKMLNQFTTHLLFPSLS